MRVRALVACLVLGGSGLGLGTPAWGQEHGEDRLAAFETTIRDLQTQVSRLQKEVAELRAALAAKPAAPSGARELGAGSREPGAGPQVFGYLQSQFETGSSRGASRFLVRRARIGLRGAIDPRFGYEIQTDAAASTAILRNAWIDYTGWRGDSWSPVLRFGQFKLPYSLEMIESAATLPTIERAFVVEQLAFTHDRDTGLALQSRAGPHRAYAYQLSLTNGAGRNQFTATRTKLFAGRVQINTPQEHPLLGGSLALGFSTRQGHVDNLNRATAERPEDEHYGVDLDYLASRWRLRGEYLWGRDDRRKPSGYYGIAAYHPRPKLELVGRYEGFRADEGGDASHRTTLGANYTFSRNTKAMLDYEFVNGRAPGDLRSGLRFRLQTLFP